MRGRIHALDGLRGLAALVVVVSHVLLVDPQLDSADSGSSVALHGWRSWVCDTPLVLFWNGRSAVLVFFVLSGYVLARAADGQWGRYYARRLVRLYLPVFAAVLLAVVWALSVRRHLIPAASGWLNLHEQPTWSAVGRDALLLGLTPGATNTVLWSLKWEVYFSLLLPAAVFMARFLRRVPIAVSWVVLAADTAAMGGAAAQYLPVFGLGAVLAFRPVTLPRRGWWIAAALIGLNATWIVQHFVVLTPYGACFAVQVLSAAVLVAAVAQGGGSAVSSRPVQWLGSRSFSLYLVHEPLIVSLALLSGGRPNQAWFLPVCLAGSALLAEAFYRTVEHPSHRLARAVGQLRRGGEGIQQGSRRELDTGADRAVPVR